MTLILYNLKINKSPFTAFGGQQIAGRHQTESLKGYAVAWYSQGSSLLRLGNSNYILGLSYYSSALMLAHPQYTNRFHTSAAPFGVPVKPVDEKPKWLSKEERAQFTLSSELKDILIGLCLGDLHIQKEYANARLQFIQGTVHKEYLFQLYGLLGPYCSSEPIVRNLKPDRISGKVHSTIRFSTRSLPCFNELYNLFYFFTFFLFF